MAKRLVKTKAQRKGIQRELTSHIMTRWYRAPELILLEKDYGPAIDMWSIGCIFAELMRRRPIFMCNSEEEVLIKCFYLLGCPTQDFCPEIMKLPKYRLFDDSKWSDYRRPHLREYFKQAPPDAIDLLERLLELDPDKRILAKEALQHPFFRI